jgi:hypothetical protein
VLSVKMFLFSCDPATAAYPAGYGNVKPSQSWFKLGFPSGYVADVLQYLPVLCELGFAKDVRVTGTINLQLLQGYGSDTALVISSSKLFSYDFVGGTLLIICLIQWKPGQKRRDSRVQYRPVKDE